jgi:hypothetical protein
MSIAAENTNIGASPKVTAVMAQQRRLLKRWDAVSHYLAGVCTGLYLPGIDQTFDKPIRRVSGRRPPLLVLEGDGLNLTGSISRPQNNKLVYTPIFSYDLTMPYTPRGGGRVLPANNLVLARRANELLAALVAYGHRVANDAHDELPVFVFPQALRDMSGKIVAEDYTPVLGFETDNPAAAMETVYIKHPNPAPKILARHGIEFPMSLTPSELDDLVIEFRAEFNDADIDWGIAVDAILFQRPYCSFSVPLAEALSSAPDAVVSAMRGELRDKHQWEASYADLLCAAQNPGQMLRISRLSAMQTFPVESAQEMPEDYAGTVLAPVDWTPPPGAAGSFGASTPAAPRAPTTAAA